MDNQQYRELMYHLKYLENMLEVVADNVDSPETGGGGNAPFAANFLTFTCLLVKK